MFHRSVFPLLFLGLALGGFSTAGLAKSAPEKPHPDLVLQLGHTGEVDSVAYSPDGARIASGSADGTIKIWDEREGDVLRTLSGHSRGVKSVAYFPDGKTLASSGGDRMVRIWDTETGELKETLQGEPEYVSALAVSPDGRMVAMAGGKLDAAEAADEVLVWDPTSGKRLHALPADGAIHTLAFSLDGHTLLAGEERVAVGKPVSIVRQWDAATGTVLPALTLNGPDLRSLALSPGGTLIAAAGADGTTWVWETANGKLRQHLGEQKRALNVVAFSADSRTLASAGEGGVISLWDTFNGKLRHRLRNHAPELAVTALAISPDETRLACGSRDEEAVHNHDAYSGSVETWDTRSGSTKWIRAGHGVTVNSVALSPDGRLLATGNSDGPVRLWYLDQPNVGRMREPHADPSRIGVPSVAFSADRKMLANTRADDTVELWDVRTGRLEERFHDEMTHLGPVQFSPDGKLLACGGQLRQQVVTVWDVKSRVPVLRQLGPQQVLALAYSPGGQWLAAGTNRGAQVWNADTGFERHNLDGHGPPSPAVAYGAGGHTLITAIGHDVIEWDAVTGERLRVLHGHTDDVNAVALSPDGRTLATAGYDRTIRIWDAESGRPITTLEGHTNTVTALMFAPDGTLISAARDGTVRYWQPREERLLITLLALPAHHEQEGDIATGWLAYTPEGYYYGSESEYRYLRWRVGDKLSREYNFHTEFHQKRIVRKILLREQ